MTQQQPQSPAKRSQRIHGAGAFDIRNVIGALLGIYGVVLLISYFLLSPGTDMTTGQAKDASYNLWTGLALALAAIVFFIWTKVDPIKIVEPAPGEAVQAQERA
ncbi:hypothetical protein [Corynebacterium heidelbergense]|uniref:Cell wall anchor protein n=1 Tax=Corynebacterium heidelbergense TaxID=2055947 RepID=A0A364VAG2_9CORY|nr:hypothetical protein [Corynebacterium heidelbergense]RAV33642.1 hypothetical protein CWC39_07370 [Corynebacterium heidelbergense]WCZ37518.1 hypothetical protein CHEID_09970 [Corynebacterium heidelbergense]